MARTKCCLDDGRDACARMKTEDPEHPWNYVCILHLLRFIADMKKPSSGFGPLEYKMMRGVPEPPKTDPEKPHQWERGYLTGMHGPWRCTVCSLTIEGGVFPPSEAAYGGCPGKEVHWESYHHRAMTYRRES